MHFKNNYMNQVQEVDNVFEKKLMRINVDSEIVNIMKNAKSSRIENKEHKVMELRLRQQGALRSNERAIKRNKSQGALPRWEQM